MAGSPQVYLVGRRAKELAVKFTAFSLVINAPDPGTGVVMDQHEKLESVIRLGQLVEEYALLDHLSEGRLL